MGCLGELKLAEAQGRAYAHTCVALLVGLSQLGLGASTKVLATAGLVHCANAEGWQPVQQLTYVLRTLLLIQALASEVMLPATVVERFADMPR